MWSNGTATAHDVRKGGQQPSNGAAKSQSPDCGKQINPRAAEQVKNAIKRATSKGK